MRDIDTIIQQLAQTYPDIIHEQLKVPQPGADDDGIWFFRHPNSPLEVQLESYTGQCPFLFETDASNATATAATVAAAVAMVANGLGIITPAA
jgi:hypothetical protein